MRASVLFLISFACAATSFASVNGLPVGRTGSFGEPTCESLGCHRPLPIGGAASVSIEVGPYIAGQTQRVLVVIEDRNASRWGFQLTVRRASDTSQPAGTLAPANNFSTIRCADGTLAPCDGGVEYATHTSLGTQANQQGGTIRYALDWTPPGSDAGNVIFAAAGLGSNNDGGVNSDRTATTTTLSLFAPANQPTISTGGAVSAASFQTDERGLTPGALLSIFGQNLAAPGTIRSVGLADLDGGDLPTVFNRLSVEFQVAGELGPRLGHMLFVSPGQINVQAPDFASTRGEAVEVTPVFNRGQGANEIRGGSIMSQTHPSSPGLFTLDSSGRNDIAAVHNNNAQLVAALGRFPGSSPAIPGEVILMFGAGFGDTSPGVPAGELVGDVARLTGNLEIEIGGIPTGPGDILFRGLAPNFAGLYQFNVRIPANVPPGRQPILFRYNGFATQPGTVIEIGQ